MAVNTIDKLQFLSFINDIYRKLIKFTSIFYKIRDRLPLGVKRMIYFAFVYSQLSNGIEIYVNTYRKTVISCFSI